MRRVRVAVAVPALEPLTYQVPDGWPAPAIGARVLVPLGTRVVTGICVGDDDAVSEREGGAAVKDVIDVLDVDAFLPADVVTLALWVAEYYACGAGDALGAAMPPRAWVESERIARITEAGHVRMLTERGVRRELLERLEADKPVRVESLTSDGRGRHAALLALERDGLIENLASPGRQRLGVPHDPGRDDHRTGARRAHAGAAGRAP